MRFKRTDTMRVKKNYIHIKRDYCLCYALDFNNYCGSICPKHNDFPNCKCEIMPFIDYAEKKLGMCGEFRQ